MRPRAPELAALARTVLLVCLPLVGHRPSCNAASPLIGTRRTLALAADSTLLVRHCSFDLYVSHTVPGNDDHIFDVVPALNGHADGVSFQSTNYRDHFITLDPNAGREAGRLGLATVAGTDDAKAAASFLPVPGLAQPAATSLQSLSAKYPGAYVTANGLQQGPCASKYSAGSDVALVAQPAAHANATFVITGMPPPPPIRVAINTANVTHRVPGDYMGCHSDSGYTHQVRGFYSQLVFGGSFEAAPKMPVTWPETVRLGTAQGNATLTGAPFHGLTSLDVRFTGGEGMVARGNRGLGNEGLHLEAGKEYEGYFFVKAAAAVSVAVGLQDYDSGAVLAATTLAFPGGDWAMLNFSLTPNASSTCAGIPPGSDPSVDCGGMGSEPGHICIRCTGQFLIGLAAPGEAALDFVFLQPGAWGRLRPDLPVRLGPVSTLQSIGVRSIRQGGTFTDTSYYFWKNWRGKPWERPSVGATWGQSLESGWGPFEMIEMCEAAGFEPIITTTAQSSDCCPPEDMADLVEYCYGNASTTWGQLRIADGHPEPYAVRIFELGNEQYNSVYVDQVKAMEARATALGLPRTLYYMFPSNGYLKPADLAAAEALGLGDHLLVDLHNGGGGAVATSAAMFAHNTSATFGSINCETNAGTHHMARALQESADLSAFFSQHIPTTSGDTRMPFRIKGRTASFCTERSGHYDAFDQGITFFLPNMTWIQPPGYVHQMVNTTWQPNALGLSTNSTSATTSIAAQASDDKTTLRVMLTNNNDSPLSVTFALSGPGSWSPQVHITTLASRDPDAANTPASPTLIAPVAVTATLARADSVREGRGGSLTVPGTSFSTLVFTAA